ncbi:MAG: endonuclease/exonuclease/phosphatase family protein [Paracoccaceae bacterium]
MLLLAALFSLALLLGFAGKLHPFFDAIAAGRWFSVFGLMVSLNVYFLSVGRYWAGIIVFSLLTAFGAGLVITPDGESGSVRVYSKNLFFRNSETSELVADIRTADPDIVVLQEVSAHNQAVLTELETTLAYQAVCPWQGWNGIAILSRWPLSQAGPTCSPERSLMAIEVERPNDPFWVVGVHLQQPWPDVQWLHLEMALPLLEGIDHGAIVAGDFNTMPWTAAALQIGEMTKTRNVRAGWSTFYLWGIGLPLDQVWALGGRAQVRPAFGSDHLGVLADVWPSQIVN